MFKVGHNSVFRGTACLRMDTTVCSEVNVVCRARTEGRGQRYVGVSRAGITAFLEIRLPLNFVLSKSFIITLSNSGGKAMGGWDGGIRVPTLMRWRDVIPAATQLDVATSQMDLLPTLASATGVRLPDDR